MSNNQTTKDSDRPRRLKFTPIQDYRLKPLPTPTNPIIGQHIDHRIIQQENKTKTPPDRVRTKPRKTKSLATVVSLPKQPAKKRGKTSASARKNISGSLIYFLRLSIAGIGIAAIAGTVLSHSTKYTAADAQAESTNETVQKSFLQNQPQELSLSESIPVLETKVGELASQWPKLEPGAFLLDLDTGNHVDVRGSTAFSAASSIKIPILVAFFQEVDAGNITLDEMLTMKPELIAKGSGNMQYQEPGTEFTALETAIKTIVISDNTGTNMLVERIGGAEKLNQRFREWGLTATVIRNPLPDLEGTNTTSPKDLVKLLAMVNRGELLTLRSRDRLLGIMEKTKTRTLLPQGLGKGAIIAHKTGDIGSVLADAGIVDMPNGKRYITAVIVKRPHNDSTARTLIQQISKAFYQYLENPNPTLEEKSAENNDEVEINNEQ